MTPLPGIALTPAVRNAVRIGTGGLMVAVAPVAFAWSAEDRSRSRLISLGGGLAEAAIGVAALTVGSRIPFIRTYGQAERKGLGIGLMVGGALAALAGNELLRRAEPRGLDPSIDIASDRQTPLSKDDLYKGAETYADEFDALVTELTSSPTGRKVWDAFLDTGTPVSILSNDAYLDRWPSKGWTGGVFVHGPDHEIALRGEAVLKDEARGAAILAHEAMHAIDAANGSDLSTDEREGRAYTVGEQVGRELGLMYVSGLGTNRWDHSPLTLEESIAAVEADDRYSRS